MRLPRAVGALALVGVVAALVGRAGETHATIRDLTKKQATAIALKALKPTRGQIVFALPAPLAAKQRVGEAFGPQRPAGKRAWLFWADQTPYAYFQHPSRLVLVDARTGRVIRNQAMSWWPLVSGRAPVFVRSPRAYAQRRYRVGPSVRRASSGARLPRLHPSGDGRLHAVPAGAYKDDCLIVMGPYNDQEFGESPKAVEKWADEVGLQRTRVDPDADGTNTDGLPTDGDLGVTIGKMTRRPKNCKDVFLYLFGHGRKPPSGKPDPFADGGSFRGSYTGISEEELPAVSMVSDGLVLSRGGVDGRDHITSKEIRELFTAFAKQGITFKLAVESCYSGRIANDLQRDSPPNLLITLTSTSADRPSFGRVQGKKGQDVGIAWTIDANGKTQNRFTQVELPTDRSPVGPGEFATGLIGGYRAFAKSQTQVTEATSQSQSTGVPLLVFALRDAFGASSRFDLVAKNGVTKPRIVFDAPPTLTSFAATRTGTHTLYKVEARDPEGRSLRYAWSTTNTCGTFSATGGTADWDHPHPPCPNELTHPAVITVTVSDGFWDCVFAYGSGSAAIAPFDPPERCVRR